MVIVRASKQKILGLLIPVDIILLYVMQGQQE
jgi:hypothetical protein